MKKDPFDDFNQTSFIYNLNERFRENHLHLDGDDDEELFKHFPQMFIDEDDIYKR